MTELNIPIPPKLIPVFAPPLGSVRYRGAHGGRGSGKSVTTAKVVAAYGAVNRMRILCCREYQNSIKESFHAELKAAIEETPWLAAHYDVGVDYLKHTRSGTEFLFKGLYRAQNTLKSLSGIDLTVIEEAEETSETSMLALEATVLRKPRSEIWSLWNPRSETSPVDRRLRGPKAYQSKIIAEVNWRDNPWFPQGLSELRQEQQRTLDPDMYHHIWEGGYLVNSDRQVYGGKWEVMAFTPEPHWDGPYYGGDFGFANDPTAAVKVWIADNCLLIEHEAGKIRLELDDTPGYMTERVPDIERHVSRWDSARPESISHISNKGLPRAVSVKKWPGSVEDGIAHIRSYKRIIVHPRCTHVANELRTYSYAVDRLTGDVKPDIIDANNHYLDALRYAIGPLIKRGKRAGVLLSSNARGG